MATDEQNAQLAARTARKRTVTRWNRRLGVALVVVFPASYLVDWLHNEYAAGVLGSWLAALNVAIQVAATVVLFTHAAYSFYVFGFPPLRANLRTVNGYAAYVVLLVFMLAQTAVGKEPMYTVLSVTAFLLIGVHVIVAVFLARRRPPNQGPTLRADVRMLVSPDAEILDKIAMEPVPTDPPALTANRLSVARGSVQVLFDVTLAIAPGTIVALLGNNGAGKTTTLRALAGLERPLAGSVTMAGHDVTELTPAGRAELGLGLVVGGHAVFPPLTVAENLAVFAHRLDRRTRDERIARAEEFFPWLKERADQAAGTLSGGEQQMLAIARAFVDPPAVLLVDEFSLGLAPRIVGQLVELIASIAAAGTAVLLVEQSANVALQLASHVLVMERGRITLSEPSGELLKDPERLTRAYLAGTVEMAETPS